MPKVFISWVYPEGNPDHFAIRYSNQDGTRIERIVDGSTRMIHFEANFGDRIHFEIFAITGEIDGKKVALDFIVH